MEALTLVSAAASHNNEHIRQQANQGRMIEIQRSIDSHSPIEVKLLDIPSRRLLREGQVTVTVGPNTGGSNSTNANNANNGSNSSSNSSSSSSSSSKLWGSKKEKVYQAWLFNDKLVLARPVTKMRNPTAFNIKYHADLDQLATATVHPDTSHHGDATREGLTLLVTLPKETWLFSLKAKDQADSWLRDLTSVIDDCREKKNHQSNRMSTSSPSPTVTKAATCTSPTPPPPSPPTNPSPGNGGERPSSLRFGMSPLRMEGADSAEVVSR